MILIYNYNIIIKNIWIVIIEKNRPKRTDRSDGQVRALTPENVIAKMIGKIKQGGAWLWSLLVQKLHKMYSDNFKLCSFFSPMIHNCSLRK